MVRVEVWEIVQLVFFHGASVSDSASSLVGTNLPYRSTSLPDPSFPQHISINNRSEQSHHRL